MKFSPSVSRRKLNAGGDEHTNNESTNRLVQMLANLAATLFTKVPNESYTIGGRSSVDWYSGLAPAPPSFLRLAGLFISSSSLVLIGYPRTEVVVITAVAMTERWGKEGGNAFVRRQRPSTTPILLISVFASSRTKHV